LRRRERFAVTELPDTLVLERHRDLGGRTGLWARRAILVVGTFAVF
jgi:hypothetical protein